MPKRSSKDADPNVLAARIVAQATEDGPDERQEPDEAALRSEAAKILGRLGGLKGGPARAAKLSKTRRSEIAKKAAAARWSNSQKSLAD